VPKQVHLARVVGERGRQRDDVLGELLEAVPPPVGRRIGLVLAPHVDRRHGPAGRCQRLEYGQEVFLAPGVAGYEQGSLPVSDSARRIGAQRGEWAAHRAYGRLPDPVGHVKRTGSAHGSAAYRSELDMAAQTPEQPL